MNRVRTGVGQRVLLADLDGAQVVYVERLELERLVRVVPERVVLAGWQHERLLAGVQRLGLRAARARVRALRPDQADPDGAAGRAVHRMRRLDLHHVRRGCTTNSYALTSVIV